MITQLEWRKIYLTERAARIKDVNELNAKIAALEADAARMDLLDSFQEAYGYEDTLEGYRWMVDGPFNSVREAIDAAMKGGA